MQIYIIIIAIRLKVRGFLVFPGVQKETSGMKMGLTVKFVECGLGYWNLNNLLI